MVIYSFLKALLNIKKTVANLFLILVWSPFDLLTPFKSFSSNSTSCRNFVFIVSTSLILCFVFMYGVNAVNNNRYIYHMLVTKKCFRVFAQMQIHSLYRKIWNRCNQSKIDYFKVSYFYILLVLSKLKPRHFKLKYFFQRY